MPCFQGVYYSFSEFEGLKDQRRGEEVAPPAIHLQMAGAYIARWRLGMQAPALVH